MIEHHIPDRTARAAHDLGLFVRRRLVVHPAERPPSLVPCEVRLRYGCLESMCGQLLHAKRPRKKSALVDAALDVEHKCAIELSRCEDHDAKYNDRSVPSSCAAHFRAPRRTTLYHSTVQSRAVSSDRRGRHPSADRARALSSRRAAVSGGCGPASTVQPAPAPHLRVRISTTSATGFISSSAGPKFQLSCGARRWWSASARRR